MKRPTVKLEDRPTNELFASEHNPRTITAERFEALKKTVADSPELLQARPLLARPSGEVIGGNMRLRAAHALGWETVPCATVDVDDETARKWALLDNNPFGEWEEQMLAEQLYELEQGGVDLDLTGFPREESTRLIDLVAGPERPHNWPDEPAPDPPAKPKSKTGQIYKLGEHRLMCGDATNPKHVAKLLDGAEPKLMVTDPPYGIHLNMDWRRGENRRKGGKIETETPATYTGSIPNDDRADWSAAFELVPSLTTAYVWHADSWAHVVAAGLERIGFRIAQQIIWDKIHFALGRSDYQWQHETAYYAARYGMEVPWYGPSHMPAIYAKKPGSGRPWLGDRTQTTVWQAPSPKRAKKMSEAADEPEDHPTQKPVLLYTRPYTNHALRHDPVYEPFSGSGTALIAGEMTGRTVYAMELDPGFCDVARERWKTYAGA